MAKNTDTIQRNIPTDADHLTQKALPALINLLDSWNKAGVNLASKRQANQLPGTEPSIMGPLPGAAQTLGSLTSGMNPPSLPPNATYVDLTGMYGQAGVDLLGNLIKASTTNHPLVMGQQALNTPIGQPMQQQQGAYSKGAQSALKKAGEAHVQEALAMGVPPEQIEASPLVQPPAPMAPPGGPEMAQTQGASQQSGMPSVGSPQPQGAQAPQQPKSLAGLGNILNILTGTTGGNYDSSGAYIPETGFFGLTREPASNILAMQQAGNLRPDSQIGLKVREANEVPLGKARKEELSIQNEMELNKQRIASGTEMAKQLYTYEKDAGEAFVKATDKIVPSLQSFGVIKDLAAQPANGANDLAMTYAFIKMNDPNAVREGEIKNLREAQSILRKYGIGAQFDRASKGTMFDAKTRKDILQASKTIYSQKSKQYESIYSRASEKLKKYGGDPNRAFMNEGLPQSSGSSETSGKLSNGIPWKVVKNG